MQERFFRALLWGVASATVAVQAIPDYQSISWVEPSSRLFEVGDDPDERFAELQAQGWSFDLLFAREISGP